MAEVGIFVGTMYGNALLVAEEAQAILSERGHQARVFEDPTLADWEGYRQKIALVVTSTTGQGELPSSIVPLYEDIHARIGHQPELRYGVIGLGDSSYTHFNGGAKKFDALLQEQGATRLGEPLFIDAADHPEPETVANPWVERWAALLS